MKTQKEPTRSAAAVLKPRTVFPLTSPSPLQTGTERIAALAYDFAHKNHKNRVSIVTKANIVKATDGKFLRLCQEMGAKYPEIVTDDWYIDIMTAKLVDPKRRQDFQVFVLPNLYGDIITDEAAEFQGGVGTAGSGNIGKRYAMFEAIHGSAPRMVKEGRAKYADPCSMLRASGHAPVPHWISKRIRPAGLPRWINACLRKKRLPSPDVTRAAPVRNSAIM